MSFFELIVAERLGRKVSRMSPSQRYWDRAETGQERVTDSWFQEVKLSSQFFEKAFQEKHNSRIQRQNTNFLTLTEKQGQEALET